VNRYSEYRFVPVPRADGFRIVRVASLGISLSSNLVVTSRSVDDRTLILSRQALPTLDRSKLASASRLRRGAYVLSDATNGKPDVLPIGTGSEVSLCLGGQIRPGSATGPLST
jgi:transketolase